MEDGLTVRTCLASCLPILAVVGAVVWSEPGECAGDPAHGAEVFRACAACHSTTPGEHMTGPSLANIWGRKAGTVEGFHRYSEAMGHVDFLWNEQNLDRWLADPAALIPGTSMTFRGLGDAKARQDVIAYLKAVSEKAPPVRQGGGAMMMNMQRGKANLKEAPAEGRVTALSHCGDTYTVKTADGKSNKVWEFNLRFKTDSSALGPPPGKPVIVGAGMQGDRASIVFASPGEISAFVRTECGQPQ